MLLGQDLGVQRFILRNDEVAVEGAQGAFAAFAAHFGGALGVGEDFVGSEGEFAVNLNVYGRKGLDCLRCGLPMRCDEHTTVEKFETTMYRLARRVPEFGVPHRPMGLAALYDVADDWVPIYDRSSLGGWFMACATSGNQFKNAPIVGHFMRAIIEADLAGHDHDLDPVRHLGPRSGRSIDLGAFSRRREPSATSGTVMG